MTLSELKIVLWYSSSSFPWNPVEMAFCDDLPLEILSNILALVTAKKERTDWSRKYYSEVPDANTTYLQRMARYTLVCKKMEQPSVAESSWYDLRETIQSIGRIAAQNSIFVRIEAWGWILGTCLRKRIEFRAGNFVRVESARSWALVAVRGLAWCLKLHAAAARPVTDLLHSEV
jgi:hypothetical protein